MTGIELNSEAWINLGISGAALFIVLIIVMLVFGQQAKSLDRLCNELANHTNAYYESNLTIREFIVANNKDQKELLRILAEQHTLLQAIYKKVVRTDARLYDMMKKENKEEQE